MPIDSFVSDKQAQEALEAFITDNPDLERLEGLLAEFNIFEALGAVRHEVHHSDFLAYLLNPQENHGLGDAFLKRLLQKSLASSGRTDLPVTLIDLDFWDLDAATVQREWQRIDIFLRDEVYQFSVIIENKIDTGEHDHQLKRYYERVQGEFPSDRILAFYLTKEGDEPTDERYIPIGYGLVCEVVENLIERRASTLGPDVRTLMTHYAQMLRRHIMSDTEVARLCGLIYKKHKAALDLIYAHRPNRQAELIDLLQNLLRAESTFAEVWNVGRGWWIGCGILGCPSYLCIMFENSPSGLILLINIGEGEQDVRRRLFDFAFAHQPPFKLPKNRLNAKNSRIYRSVFLTATDYEESDSQELEEKIRDNWKQFLIQELPAILQALAEGGWLSVSAEPQQQHLPAIPVS